jgi:hypothetical protein
LLSPGLLLSAATSLLVLAGLVGCKPGEKAANTVEGQKVLAMVREQVRELHEEVVEAVESRGKQ